MKERSDVSMKRFVQATFQWMNDLSTQGVFTTDTNLCIQTWNRWLEIHTGQAANMVIGQHLFDIVPSLIERNLDQWYRQALLGQGMILAQRLHQYLIPMHPNEGYTEFLHMQQSARIEPLLMDDVIIGTITVIDDVTEREARDAMLRRQLAAMEAIHEVSQGILSLNLHECLQRVVDITATLFHAPTVAVILRDGDELSIAASNTDTDIDPTDFNNINNLTSSAMTVIRTSKPIFIGDLIHRPDLMPLDPKSRCMIATPLIAEHRVIGALLIESPEPQAFSRFNHRKALMLATQAAIGIRNAQIYRDAQEAVKLRDTFLSIASHELKTPLTTILGNAQMFQRRNARENNLSERDKRTLDVITAQSQRLNRMIAALLDISRIDTGQLSIEHNVVDFTQLARTVVDDLKPMLEQHQISLRIPNETIYVYGDELRLEQAFQNLLQNAAKYSPDSTSIDFVIDVSDDQIKAQIIDTGIGIPEPAQAMIFTRFYRADNAQVQHISGMGVGLYVVKEVISLHGGTIEVCSQEGKGSTFTVTFPLYEPQAE
jgi:signal transduction histidine kinase